MAHKIQIKRGNKADLPVLNDGEMGLCLDTNEVFVGSNGTNIPVGVQTEIVNNLTETVTGKALDATQGKVLAEQISTKANFKNGSNTFTAGGTTYTVTDAFITANTMVIVSPTSAKLGMWTVETSAGSFTITSDVTETIAVTFDWGAIK